MTAPIFVYSNRHGERNDHANAMAMGLKAHGYEAKIVAKGTEPHPDCDFLVCWGWREGKRLRDLGYNVLVMERGYLGDRYYWTSLGWNGLNGRAVWNAPADKGERFRTYHGHLLRPWRTDRSGYALIIGQVRGDAALGDVVIARWYPEAAKAMRDRGFGVYFRPHPEAVRRGIVGNVLPSIQLRGSLDDALAGAACVVTYNSNAGVDAALAGIPVIACDEGSMALPVAARGLHADLMTPDRDDWCTRLAWRQWTIDEISSGIAWDHVKQVLPSLVKAQEPDRGARGRTALIIAGGSRVKEDIETALSLFTPDIVIAVNDIGAEYSGRLDHWVSNHPDKMAGWQAKRASNGFGPAGRIWTVTHLANGYPYQHVVNPGGGSSATAVAVAREMGAERIVLAGVPLTSTPHFFDNVPWSPREVAHYQRNWLRQKKAMAPYVRSVSGGFTEEILGRPTKEWLEIGNGVENAT